jgi:hypothetical protein
MIEAEMTALATHQETPLEFETLYLGDLDIRPCRGCRTCFDRGEERYGVLLTWGYHLAGQTGLKMGTLSRTAPIRSKSRWRGWWARWFTGL